VAPSVLETIAAHGLKPGLAAAGTAATPSFPAWLGIAVAATVLLGVSAGSFLFFSHLRERPNDQTIVKQTEVPPADPGLRVALRQLDDRDERLQLVKNLAKGSAFRLRLTVPNRGKVIAGLESALKNRFIELHADDDVRKRLKTPKGTGECLLFLEDLRPEELVVILWELGQQEGADLDGAPPAAVLFKTFRDEDRKELAQTLHVPWDKLGPPPSGPAPTEDLPDLYIIGAEKKAPRADRPPAPNPGVMRHALVLACDGLTAAPEIDRFVKSRRQPRPGTLQIVLQLSEVRA
jgi:hypothetical protein